VKILDLGLALLQGGHAASPNETGSGVVLGTFDYLAPEQGDDAHAVDGRADLYSLGCTLYHLLTGKPPFHGSSFVTPAQKMRAHALAPVPPIRERRPDVSAELAAVLDRMLAKEPENRFATAADVAAALAPFTVGANLPWLHAPRVQAAGDQPVTASLPPPKPRRRWRLVAVALALLIALIATVVILIRAALASGRSKPQTIRPTIRKRMTRLWSSPFRPRRGRARCAGLRDINSRSIAWP